MATTVREALARATEHLRAVSETPELEARLLACHAWGCDQSRLIIDLGQDCDETALEPLVQRRLAAEPIAYILGQWEFFSLEFRLEPPLLVPRPETEHLVEAALAHIGPGPARLLDLCTGTGCVALAIARNAHLASLWATDTHPVAVRVATENATRLGVPLHVAQGDLFAPLPKDAGPFDVVVSNPPYVRADAWAGLSRDIRDYEDPAALLAGEDGLDCIRRIVAEAPDWLAPGGLLALEMGEEQGMAVRDLLHARGFSGVAVTRDLAGHDRIASGMWAAESVPGG